MFFSGKNHKEQKIEQLLLENYNKYYRLAYSYVHHEADAADIVTERSVQGDQKQRCTKAGGICTDMDIPHYVKRDLRICKKEPGSFPG